ncbi:MAG: flagellar motor switch phosphatase FliY [Lachnospiraceae bacterium]|jgi:flagellar motor switch protein FliN/FliY|nr:flagellar motor switch phosphatase FliY [Lachnospiraceae bacterium]
MSDGSLSQEEIDALLNGGASSGGGDSSETSTDHLSTQESDTIGEVANICMGTAATALFSLVNKKVEISTPVVSSATWQQIIDEYDKPCVLVKITFTKGLNGSNELVLKEQDVKVITDLMMGGDGVNVTGELGEIHLSAISEAMNQMMGSSATSLSSMLNKVIDISPPTSNLIDLADAKEGGVIDDFLAGIFVKIEFHLQIGDLVDSKMMQLYPISLVHEMCNDVLSNMEADSDASASDADAPSSVGQVPQSEMQMGSLETQNQQQLQQAPPQQMQAQPQMMQPQMMQQPMMQQQMVQQPMMQVPPVDVQPAQFTSFTGGNPMIPLQENIDLIKDVPLEVTVELGRTHKSIQEILDFTPGTIIELNKIAGEPIDVLVNGKYVARGEVVVIEESFGIRITEILND